MAARSQITLRPLIGAAIAAVMLGMVAYTTQASANDEQPMIIPSEMRCISLASTAKFLKEERMTLIGTSAEINPNDGSFVVVKKLYINVDAKKAFVIAEAPSEGFACMVESMQNFAFVKSKTSK